MNLTNNKLINDTAAAVLAGAYLDLEALRSATPHDLLARNATVGPAADRVPWHPERWLGHEGKVPDALRKRLVRLRGTMEDEGLVEVNGEEMARFTEEALAVGAELAGPVTVAPRPDASQYVATRGVPEPRALRPVELALLECAVSDLQAIRTADPRGILDSTLSDLEVRAALDWNCVPYDPVRWLHHIDAEAYPRHKMENGDDLYRDFDEQVDHDLRLMEYWGLLRRRDRWGYDEPANDVTRAPLLEVLPGAWGACGIKRTT